MSFLPTLFFLSLFSILPSFHSKPSLHDPSHTFPTLNIPESFPIPPSSRILSSLYPQIRIATNFDSLGPVSEEYKYYITHDLIPPIIDYFQATLQIKYPSILPITLPADITKACGLQLPGILHKEGISADLLLMIDSERNERESWLAESMVCYLASGTQRPLIARTTINSYLIKEAKGDVLLHEKNIYIMMHEMIHVLGFSSSLYKYYLNEDGLPLKGHIKTIEDRIVIDVPALTDKLREYFGCADLEGAYMENNGGKGSIGSHFERRFFLYEVMSSGAIHDRRISEFSLGMLEASGWYLPDYNKAEPYYFGQGKGCEFIRGTLEEGEEFCKGEVKGCATHRRGAGFCTEDAKTEGYRYVLPEEGYDCENEKGIFNAKAPKLEVYGRGKMSKCFMGKGLQRFEKEDLTSFCLKYNCKESEGKVELRISVGDKEVECVKEGLVKVNGYGGEIVCPEPKRFCRTIGREYCPRGCMGRGVCNQEKKKCECKKGYSGIDCSVREKEM